MFKSWGIKVRVLLLTFVPTITISILLGIYFTSLRIQDLSDGLKDRGFAIASQLAPAAEFAVFAGDNKILQRLANLTLQEDEVRSVAIYDRNGKRMVHAGPIMNQIPIVNLEDNVKNNLAIMKTENGIRFTIPIISKETIIEDYPDSDSSNYNQINPSTKVNGWASIELATTNTTLQQYQALLASSLIVMLGLGISVLFALKMSKDVTDPIIKLSRAVENIKHGKLDTRVNLNSKGEIQRLESGINSMAESLYIAHNEMQQSVDQATGDLRETLETIEVQNIELKLAREEAEAASKVKSEFLANMSHEIRTPLNGVLGFINLILKTELSPLQKDYLTTINNSASSLLSIINDVLDFSKIEAGKLKLDYTHVDMRDCIEQALTLLAPSAHAKDIELVPLIYNDVPLKLFGDPLRIKQVITNLVNNAIKFTNSGEVIVRVMLEDEMFNKITLRISVTDTGIGLSDDDRKSLFKAFSQADTSLTRKYGGTGLGLVISKKLVEQMGGEITLESEPNKGSTFSFTIVGDKINYHDDTLTHNNLHGKSVLLYEPHEKSQLAISHMLKDYGLNVTELTDLKKATSIINKQRNGFDYAVVAINKAQDNSEALTTLLHDLTLNENTFVIILTPTTNKKLYNSYHDKFANVVLTKPIVKHKLFGALNASKELHVVNKTSEENQSYKLLNKDVKVLAVDDNDANLKLLGCLLQEQGINPTLCESPFQALETISKTEFDFVLMDIQMPGLDGIETTKKIRELNVPWSNLPVIAVTAHAMYGEKENLLNLGLSDYIAKPITEHELKELIFKWANKTKKPISTINDMSQIIIDKNLCLKLAANNKKLSQEMLAQFMSELAPSIDKINILFDNQDYKTLRDVVHKLHGGSCYVGVPDLKQKLHAYEDVLAAKQYQNLSFVHEEFKEAASLLLDEYNPEKLWG